MLVWCRVSARLVGERWAAGPVGEHTRRESLGLGDSLDLDRGGVDAVLESSETLEDFVEAPRDLQRRKRLLRTAPDERDDDAGNAPDRSHPRREGEEHLNKFLIHYPSSTRVGSFASLPYVGFRAAGFADRQTDRTGHRLQCAIRAVQTRAPSSINA